jgi:hybrid cluster-associated redox disulfide protein
MDISDKNIRSRRMIEINKDTSMGEILEKIPEAASVIKKYFHGGCYQCPGMKMETLDMAAMLHGHNVDDIISELKKVANLK